MNRNYLNLFLLAGVAGLGALIYFTREQPARLEALTPLNPADVTSVVLEIPGEATIKLAKDAQGWQILEPVRASAEGFGVDSLTAIAAAEVQNTLDPGDLELADLGLSPPASTVQLNDQRIELGGTEPLKHRRYVRLGERIALISDPPSNALDADYSELISRRLLPAGARVTGLEAPGLHLQRDGDGKWTSPEHPDESSERLATVAAAWESAEAMWNAMAPAPPGDGDKVAVRLEDGHSIDFVVASREPQFVLERPDLRLRYTVSKQLVGSMLAVAAPPAPASTPTPEATPAAPDATDLPVPAPAGAPAS